MLVAQLFKQISFDPKQCRVEIEEFGVLLQDNPVGTKSEKKEERDSDRFWVQKSIIHDIHC